MIAVFALSLRVLIFAIAIIRGHLSLAHYTSKGDTASYVANAAVICGERPLASLSEYDLRVFPGYPALIAIVHRLGISLPMSALCVTWICAAIAAAAAGRIFDDARVGWAMTCLIPHYLINSSLGMSEAPLLAAVCLALLASQRDRSILAGILFGFTGIIRPMACFAMAGLLFALIQQRRWRSVWVMTAAAIVTFAVELLLVQHWTSDVFRGVRVYAQNPSAYGGHMFAWPFHSLLTTPRLDGASGGRITYIWIHVTVTLLACGLISDRVIRAGRPDLRDSVSFPWLIGNTAFILCIGSVWGFLHFPRFTIPAAPALFWTVRKMLPRKPGWWWLIGSASGVMAVFGVIDSP